MSDPRKTAIVTGASQGIGAGIVNGFVERGDNVRLLRISYAT
jgi:NAD(P)-dependent dehydrogenase (short-subunit alcohol dehydrogenase family)